MLNFFSGASSKNNSKEIVTSFGNISIGVLFNCVLPLTGNSPSLENSMKGGTFQKVKKESKSAQGRLKKSLMRNRAKGRR